MYFTPRKQIRLNSYDYSSAGMYFITVCSKDRQKLFGQKFMQNDTAKVMLSEMGKCVEGVICEIPEHYSNVSVDKYCIMPDHIHMIICLNADTGGRIQTVCPGISAPTEKMPSVSQITGSMKRRASYLTHVSLWQKSFYEHIIRNYDDYLETIKYIEENPAKEMLT